MPTPTNTRRRSQGSGKPRADRAALADDDAAEAMRADTQETIRLNRQRRSSSESTGRELTEAAKAVAEIVRVIEQGGWHRAYPTG